jgi:hypothetical protein
VAATLSLSQLVCDLSRAAGTERAADAACYARFMQELHGEAVDARMDAILARAGAYFIGQSPVHQAAEGIARHLEEAGVDYVIAEALGLAFHGYERYTDDVDVIVTREGLEKFKERWLGLGYMNLRAGGKPVRDTIHNVKIDFLLAGDFPGDGKPKPVVVPEPRAASVAGKKYRVVSLPKLIELKLASGMSAPHRGKDLVDVQEIIHRTGIPRDFVDQLDPYVRDKFRALWELAQHPDDEY